MSRPLAAPPAWRPVCLLYAAAVVVSYMYIAQPGGPPWNPGAALPWIVVDVLLVRWMLRGSVNALIVSGALDAVALLFLIAAELFVQPQPGVAAMVALLVTRLVVLMRAWSRMADLNVQIA